MAHDLHTSGGVGIPCEYGDCTKDRITILTFKLASGRCLQPENVVSEGEKLWPNFATGGINPPG